MDKWKLNFGLGFGGNKVGGKKIRSGASNHDHIFNDAQRTVPILPTYTVHCCTNCKIFESSLDTKILNARVRLNNLGNFKSFFYRGLKNYISYSEKSQL